MQTKLRYAERFGLNPGAAGIVASHVISANGLFDPEEAHGAHQPRGFDQWMSMWSQYGVTEARITVWFSASSVLADAMVCGIAVADSLTQSTVFTDLTEHYDVVTTVVGQGSGGIGGPMRLSKTVNILKFLGRDTDIADDSDLLGSISANPADSVYFHVFATPVDAAADALAIDCYIVIDYACDLSSSWYGSDW